MADLKMKYVSRIALEDYQRLRQAVGWPPLAEAQAKRSLKRSAYLTAARLGGKTVGMARVLSDGAYFFFIVDVIVQPDFQRRGIGTGLMKNVMAFLLEQLSPDTTISVNLMASGGKEDFYRRFGFKARPWDIYGPGMSLLLQG